MHPHRTRIVLSVVVLFLFGFFPAQLGCKSGLLPGYRALAIVHQAGESTSKVFGQVIMAARDRCFEKHKPPSAEYTKCIAMYKEAGQKWVKYAKPSINAALIATYGALETAHQAKKDELDWMATLKPGLCALVGILAEYKDLMGDKAAEILGPVTSIGKVVCQ